MADGLAQGLLRLPVGEDIEGGYFAEVLAGAYYERTRAAAGATVVLKVDDVGMDMIMTGEVEFDGFADGPVDAVGIGASSFKKAADVLEDEEPGLYVAHPLDAFDHQRVALQFVALFVVGYRHALAGRRSNKHIQLVATGADVPALQFGGYFEAGGLLRYIIADVAGGMGALAIESLEHEPPRDDLDGGHALQPLLLEAIAADARSAEEADVGDGPWFHWR